MELIDSCHKLISAYKKGLLGDTTMPEDCHPDFGNDKEQQLIFFTLPMALNYQRNSYKLREAVTQAYIDSNTNGIFNIHQVTQSSTENLQHALTKHKVALQPNKHTSTRQRIATTIHNNRGSLQGLLEDSSYDFLKLQQYIQYKYKGSFPYLSGPKIFHYRSYILGEYCDITLDNKDYIQIAPDTHVIKCSIKLGVITEQESLSMTRDQISQKRRESLIGSNISPIDMHSPLWFWSRNDFQYQLIQ